MTTTEETPQTESTTVAIPVRLAVDELSPRANRALNSLDAAVRDTTLERRLQEIVRLRASQLNGCAYCVDIHSNDAVEAGLSEAAVRLVAVWREAPFFTVRERAALELAEAMTKLSEAPITDELFGSVAGHFTDRELSDLIWLVVTINAWNRLGATAHPWPLG